MAHGIQMLGCCERSLSDSILSSGGDQHTVINRRHLSSPPPSPHAIQHKPGNRLAADGALPLAHAARLEVPRETPQPPRPGVQSVHQTHKGLTWIRSGFSRPHCGHQGPVERVILAQLVLYRACGVVGAVRFQVLYDVQEKMRAFHVHAYAVVQPVQRKASHPVRIGKRVTTTSGGARG